MSNNQDFALYLMGLLTILGLLAGEDDTAWIGLLILIAGMVLWLLLEGATWLEDQIESRRDKEKRK